jgi:hypothetical protein
MLSWAVGGSPTANAIGIFGVLGGVGHFASRLVLGLEAITQRAYEALLQRRQHEQNRELDELERQLSTDQDPRTDSCLRELRGLYETFQKSCTQGRTVATQHQVISQVEQVFQASVQQLRRSLQLYDISQELSPQSRAEILAERERVIEDVLETRAHLSATIEEFQSLVTRRDQSDLSRLREELDETLRVAKKTEERMAVIGRNEQSYDESEFE